MAERARATVAPQQQGEISQDHHEGEEVPKFLKKLAEAITAPVKLTTAEVTAQQDNARQEVAKLRLGAESLLSRYQAGLNDVHGLVLQRIGELEDVLAALKLQVEQKKNKAQQQATVYVELADDALRATQDISRTIASLAAHVDQL